MRKDKLVTLTALLALFSLPFLGTSKHCITDDDCVVGENYRRICIQGKCEKGTRFIALLTSAGSIGSIADPTQPFFEPKVTFFTIDIGIASNNIVYANNLNRLYAVDLQTQTTTLVNSFPRLMLGPITGGPDDLIYILVSASPNPGAILYTIDPATANILSSVAVPDLIGVSGDIAWVPRLNTFYFASAETGALYKFTLAGVLTYISNPTTNKIFGLSHYEGMLYAYDSSGYQSVIDPETGVVTSSQTVANLDGVIWSAGR